MRPIERAGFVGIVGRPNVGKSTLLNQLVGEKLAIATPRPQTTRNRLLAVKNVDGAQLALVDTPGLHRPGGPGRTALNRFMLEEALGVLAEVDVVLLLTDLRQRAAAPAEEPPAISPGDRYAAELLRESGKPAVVGINKIDRLRDRRLLLPLMEEWQRLLQPQAIVPLSALKGDGLDRLLGELVALLPAGPALFPEEMVTDRAERWLAAEFVREQVFLATRQEVPYAVAVTVDDWQERTALPRAPGPRRRGRQADALPAEPAPGERLGVSIHATVHVEKEAQKKIIVGEGGRMIRDIGTRARAEISRLLGCPVHLELFVRVDPRWSQTPAKLREMGYEPPAGGAQPPRAPGSR